MPAPPVAFSNRNYLANTSTCYETAILRGIRVRTGLQGATAHLGRSSERQAPGS